ncbi:hypothetical protein HMPREF0322_03398 [Desulfitobacterium hafniense DP7]|uniref:Uncharacterized protein n=1 Tax=Desulfitobacterium hafniense DP7 TaxID=537010 RepID=G9XQZ9_DESHA|nr:hypothetical protein HMPREF0322_03398 [Desulfitobacterium hafniense DP7]
MSIPLHFSSHFRRLLLYSHRCQSKFSAMTLLKLFKTLFSYIA